MSTRRVKSGRCVKCMNAKNKNKSLIHENADANITYYFGDIDISHYRSQFPHTRAHTATHTHIVSSIIVRLFIIMHLPATMMYGAETWAVKKAQEKKVNVAEMRMRGAELGVKELEGQRRWEKISKKVQESRLKYITCHMCMY